MKQRALKQVDERPDCELSHEPDEIRREAAMHRAGEVLIEVHDEQGTRVRARLPEREAGHFAAFTSRELVSP